ncbi:MAG: diaminopimelate decarboxylase, partial [Alphaproteobacteria bacterium]|nr:diaminopimelate decarboxylase [Alphaproteobacteria bacterium]
MSGFTRDHNRLHVDGLPLEDIAAEFGTPLYVYSADAITAAYTRFHGAVAGADGRIHFALKANSNMAVLRLLARLGAGADIVSGGEMQRALAAGIAPEKIIFSGVGKTDVELLAAFEAGIGQINAESPAEVDAIIRLAEAHGHHCRVALRVNPDVDAKTHAKIATGKSDTKFGISMEDCPPLYRRMAESQVITPAGLAVHIGSQLTTLAPFEKAYLELLELADGLRAEGYDVPVLDLGGGLGIDYQGDSLPDFAAYGALVTRIFSNRGYRLGFEPGRSIAADNGLLLTRTHYIKQGEDKRFIIVDGAMNDLIRPTLYEAYHRIEPVTDKGAPCGMADIVGPVCETGDYLGQGRDMPDIGEGDLLAVFSAGAYGAVM